MHLSWVFPCNMTLVFQKQNDFVQRTDCHSHRVKEIYMLCREADTHCQINQQTGSRESDEKFNIWTKDATFSDSSWFGHRLSQDQINCMLFCEFIKKNKIENNSSFEWPNLYQAASKGWCVSGALRRLNPGYQLNDRHSHNSPTQPGTLFLMRLHNQTA